MVRAAAALAVLALASVAGALGLIGWAQADGRGHALQAADRPSSAIVFYLPDDQVLARYLHEAAQLYRAGRIGQIVCVGGARPARDYFGAAQMARQLLAQGLPADALRCGDRRSDDSVSNLQAARSQLTPDDFEHAVMVTDALHAARLRHLARVHLDRVPRWQQTPPAGPLPAQLLRAYWEMPAWLLELAPPSWRRWAIDASRS